MAQVTVVWDDAAIKLETTTPGGPVDRAMRRLADAAVLSMKARCPVYTGPPRIGPVPGHPRQARRASGTLRNSIKAFRRPDGSYLIGPTDTVGDPPRLLGPLLEHGTPPHVITPRGDWPLYSAPYRQSFGRAVNHPGTSARPFIRPAARDLNGVTIHIS